jgi:NAD(P)-dependent dehydrogenase (short-subunit alcohol dehydrogenase family)
MNVLFYEGHLMTFPDRLSGRTALITGASSGIGERLARVFAEAGAQVVLGARRAPSIERIAAEIGADGGKALAVSLDVTDDESIKAAFDAGEHAFGTIDTIIANAGTASGGRSTELETPIVRQLLDTNLLGVYLTAREGARRLIAAGARENERGRIVLIGSITADMTGQGDAAYAASKAGVAHLGRQFAREWVRQGINVNTIQPGYIQTELSGGWFDEEGGRAQIATWHRRRLISVEALDDIALYLCSDASRFVTGSTFTIDDGQSL